MCRKFQRAQNSKLSRIDFIVGNLFRNRVKELDRSTHVVFLQEISELWLHAI